MPKHAPRDTSSVSLLPDDLALVPEHLADRYEAQADHFWQAFYTRNTTNFYKNRHYLDKEFPDLVAGPATLLEVGCGVGNTFWPLIERNPNLRVYACDFAPKAIELIHQQPGYASGRVHAFVADLTAHDLQAVGTIPPGSVDLATMVFVLSAIHPQHMAAAVHNVARCLRPGGRLLFRDYAQGDLAQDRLALQGARRLPGGENFYLRGDGTRCYYFDPEEVGPLFGAAGFRCDAVKVHERGIDNHKRGITMHRRWLQAILTLEQHTLPPGVLSFQNMLVQRPQSLTPAQAQAQAQAGQASSSVAAQLADMSMHDDGDHDGMDMEHDDGAAASDHHAGHHAGVHGANPAAISVTGPGVLGGSWLTGAAARLASHLAAGPGTPSGRASLPDTLDSPDELIACLSPAAASSAHSTGGSHAAQHTRMSALASGGGGASAAPGSYGHYHAADGGGSHPHAQSGLGGVAGAAGGGVASSGGAAGSSSCTRALEAELERQFFETIGRNAEEVVAEEVAAAGRALAGVRLVDVSELAATAAVMNMNNGGGGAASLSLPLSSPQPVAAPPPEVDVDVTFAPGVSYVLRCQLTPAGQPAPPPDAALAVARLVLAVPSLVQGQSVLLLGGSSRPAPSVSSSSSSSSSSAATTALAAAAMAAARAGARRVMATSGARPDLEAAAALLKSNAARVVVERLKLAPLDWISPASSKFHLRELIRSLAKASPAVSVLGSGGSGGGAAAPAAQQSGVPGLSQAQQQQGGFFSLIMLPDTSPLEQAAAAGAGSGSGVGVSASNALQGLLSAAAHLALRSSAMQQAQTPSPSPYYTASSLPTPSPSPLCCYLLAPLAPSLVHEAQFIAAAGAACGWSVPQPGEVPAAVARACEVYQAACGSPLLALRFH